MWEAANYNGAQYQADMELIRSLGFNTVRVFAAARNGVFDYPGPPAPAELANLTDFFNRAHAAGVRVHLTLFDHWWAFGQISGSKTWAGAILGAIPDHGDLQAVEIKNEVSYASAMPYRTGFDSGWPSGTPRHDELGQVACVWASQMIPYVAGLTGAPVVTSCTSGTADLRALFQAVNGTSGAPSWYEWHCYALAPNIASTRGISGISSPAYAALKRVIDVVGDPAGLFIGESGANTSPGGANGGNPSLPAECGPAQARQAQLNYLQGVRWACQQLGLNDPAPWILYDMAPSAQFSAGQTFGLFTTSGQAKPIVEHYRQVPPGSRAIPPVSINGEMTGTPQADAAGNLLPPQWTLYQGERNGQPIAATVDQQNTYEGHPSVVLSGSAGTVPGDNSPALEIASPAGWPVITGQAGQRCIFSVALKAAGSYGNGRNHPSLAISWYHYEPAGSKYISSVNGQLLRLTGEFQMFSLAGTIPPGADFARMFVRVGYNAGRIWAAGANWSGPAGP